MEVNRALPGKRCPSGKLCFLFSLKTAKKYWVSVVGKIRLNTEKI